LRDRARTALILILFVTGLGTGARTARAADPVASWTPFGPGAGRFQHLTADPASPSTLYAVALLDEVYKSTDAGQSWRWSSAGLPAGSPLGPVVVDPAHPRVLFLADFQPYWHNLAGIYRSRDAGHSWTRVTPPVDLDTQTPALWIAPGEPSVLFAASPQAVFRSVDGGNSWSPVPEIVPPLAVSPGVSGEGPGPAVVYAVSSTAPGGLAVSIDRGASWQSLAGPGGEVRFLAVSGTASGTLAAATALGLFTTATGRPGGPEWHAVSPAPSSAVTALAAVPGAGSSFYASWGGLVFRSGDGGATWTAVPLGAPPRAVDELTPDGGTLFVHTVRGRLLEGRPAGSFTDVSEMGLLTFGVDFLRFDPVDPRTSYLEIQAFGETFPVLEKSTDGGASWTRLSRAVADLDAVDSSRVYAADGAVLASDDGGETWRTVLAATDVLHVLHVDGQTVLAGGCGIKQSTNGGRTWRQALPCFHLQGTVKLHDNIRRMVRDPKDPATVFAEADEDGDDPSCNHHGCEASPLFRSRNGGHTWTRLESVGGSLSFTGGSGRRQAVLLGLIFLTSPQTVNGWATSTDFGQSWKPITLPGVPDASQVQVVGDPSRPSGLYALIDSSNPADAPSPNLFYSRNLGASWTLLDAGGSSRAIARPTPGELLPDPAIPGRLYDLLDGGLLTTQVTPP
jgi:photosystem II stability/assembly factor-like uncharacterized protein